MQRVLESENLLPRALLLAGCLSGISIYIVTPLANPDQVMLASDVYAHAVGEYVANGVLYGVHPPDRPGYTFLYPPISIIAFIPHALLGTGIPAYVLQTMLNVVAAIGTAILIARGLERRAVTVERLDRGLLIAFMLISSYSAIQFLNGQINLWLAFFLALGFELIDRDRGRLAGILFAVAALFKVFPAIIGVWLLRIRVWTAVGTAVLTGIAALGVGALLLGPDLTGTYLLEVLLDRFAGETYDGRPDPTDNVDGVHRQLAALWPAGAPYHSIVGAVIVGIPLLASYQQTITQHQRDGAALATLVAILLFLPLQPLYFPLITFPLFMLLYTATDPGTRLLLGTGTLLTVLHLDLESVELGFGVMPLPSVILETTREGLALLFTVILPPTAGLWVLLGACVWLHYGTRELNRRNTTPTVA